MAGDDHRTDEMKGRARKAWGELTGDQEQKEKGTVDKTSAKIKEGVESARQKAGDLLNRNKGET